MIYTYSTKEKAIEAIPGFCKKMEQDVFVYYVPYPHGEEWSLRMRDQILDEDSTRIEHKYYLPIEHHFADRDNVLRESVVWEKRLGQKLTIDRHCKTERGYPIFSHYTLKV